MGEPVMERPDGAERAEAEEPLHLEAEPMEPEPAGPGVGRRLYRAVGPVVVGMAIDAVDLFTMGPLGAVIGLMCGGLLGAMMGLRPVHAFLAGIACGLYCMFPPTSFLPLATLFAACVRFFQDERREPAGS